MQSHVCALLKIIYFNLFFIFTHICCATCKRVVCCLNVISFGMNCRVFKTKYKVQPSFFSHQNLSCLLITRIWIVTKRFIPNND